MEIIGILAVSLVCVVAVVFLVGLPWIALGFGGPSVGNWAWMIGGLVLASMVVLGWWHFVGSKIHVGFG